MNTTFKNKKYKKINRTIKRNQNILKGGKNFIEYLFNVNDKCEINNVDRNESEGNFGISVARGNENERTNAKSYRG